MKELNIAIIGGGLAGLTAAYLLKKKLILPDHIQIHVHLYEATDRVGGRVYTLRSFDDELYAEAGAISIGNNENDILNLARELNVNITKRLDRQKRNYFEEGEWKTKSDIGTITAFLMQEIGQLHRELIIVGESDWTSKDTRKQTVLDNLDNITIIDFLKKAVDEKTLILEHPNRLHMYVAASLLGHYASDVNKLSAFDALRFLSQYFDTKWVYSIEDGNDSLAKAIYNSIVNDCDVNLNSPVYQVKTNDNSIISTVTINSESGKKKIDFDYVIMAVPLSSLQIHNDKSIKFKPPLPQMKFEAVNNVPYNQSVARIYYEVNSKAWDENNSDATITITDKLTLWIENHTAFLPNKLHTVIEAHAGGSVGESIQKSENSSEAATEEITSILGNQFNQARTSKLPTTFFWANQRYQKGAYPHLWPGQRKYIEEMGRSIGNLFFIGEYTSIGHPASMNGAVRSAYRVLHELGEILKIRFSQTNQQSTALYQ